MSEHEDIMVYRNMNGDEAIYYDGYIEIWKDHGVYEIDAIEMQKSKHDHGPLVAGFDLIDTEGKEEATITIEYDAQFDLYELIYRWVSGNLACDCARGDMFHGPQKDRVFKCNKNRPNRFVLRKMAIIRGNEITNILNYRCLL